VIDIPDESDFMAMSPQRQVAVDRSRRNPIIGDRQRHAEENRPSSKGNNHDAEGRAPLQGS
jgi:hypothetical protein